VSLQVGEDDLDQALTSAVVCCILAAAGPQRSRVLANLYKDERCARLPVFPFLEKVYLERILRRQEVKIPGSLEDAEVADAMHRCILLLKSFPVLGLHDLAERFHLQTPWQRCCRSSLPDGKRNPFQFEPGALELQMSSGSVASARRGLVIHCWQ